MKNNIIKEIDAKFAKKNIFYNKLFDDYLLLFIDKNFKGQNNKSIISIKSFMKIILENKFNLNEDNLDIQKISTLFNWIESYSLEIISMIKMFVFLNSYKKNDDLNEKIKNQIPKTNIDYNKLNISNNIKIINRVFYNIIDSLISILISDLNQILSEIKDQESLDTLLDNLNNIYYALLSINNILNLSSKEIYLLHETIKIISIFSFNNNEEEVNKNKKLLIDFIQKKIIKENKEDNKQINKIERPKLKTQNNKEQVETEDTEEEKNLKMNLNNFSDYYKQQNNINFADSFSSVLFDEFNKEFNEKYRQHILTTILNDDNLIRHNILLIKILLAECVKPNREIIYKAIDYISNEEIYFCFLNESNKNIVNKIIMQIFDTTINLYFNSLQNVEDYIISDLFNIFKEYLIVISDNNYERYYENYYNENLVKIYILSFIKIYLNKFVELICDKKSSLQGNESRIIEEICKESSISNTLKMYFIILLYNKNKSLDLLQEKLYKPIENFVKEIKNEIGQNNFDNILNNLLIPKDDKYLFNEFFTYIKYPSYENFVSKFLSLNENKEKYPLINEYIKNDSGPKNLKDLRDYVDFINLMINYYSGRVSRNDANDGNKNLNLEDIYKNDENNFRNKLDKFKNIWNNTLSKQVKNNNNSKKFLDKFKGNERLSYYLIDNDDKGFGIFIADGLKKFIEWQNSF